MPLVSIQSSVPVSKEQEALLLEAVSTSIAAILGKPQKYVMVTLSPAAILMGGKSDPAAAVDIRSIGGLDWKSNKKISQDICGILERKLGIEGSRVYLTFHDVAAANWGWNGSTFE